MYNLFLTVWRCFLLNSVILGQKQEPLRHAWHRSFLHCSLWHALPRKEALGLELPFGELWNVSRFWSGHEITSQAAMKGTSGATVTRNWFDKNHWDRIGRNFWGGWSGHNKKLWDCRDKFVCLSTLFFCLNLVSIVPCQVHSF